MPTWSDNSLETVGKVCLPRKRKGAESDTARMDVGQVKTIDVNYVLHFANFPITTIFPYLPICLHLTLRNTIMCNQTLLSHTPQKTQPKGMSIPRSASTIPR